MEPESVMSLKEDRKELLRLIEFELERLTEHPPVDRLGEICDYLCLYYRTLAKCKILLDGDTEAFYHTLVKSGQVRVYYLKRCKEIKGFMDIYLASSYGRAIFDTLAARAFDLAREIAALSSKVWYEGDEYEDDFCFVHFFNLLQEVSPSHERLVTTLGQFERSLQGDESTRLTICKALLDLDQEQFDAAFELLLDEREAELEGDKKRFFTDEIVFHTKRRIYTEGLAILNVADRLGLRTKAEYRYCPKLCRLPMRTPFPTEKVIDWQ